MKNSILFILSFLFMTWTAEGKNVKDNFYIGLGGFDSINQFTLKSENQITSFSVTKKKNHDTVIGSGFLGYGYTTHCGFFLAGELGSYFPRRSVKVTRPGVTITPATFQDRISVQDYLTGDLLLGVRPKDCFVIYMRGGATWANLKLHQFANSSAPSFDGSQNRAGGRIGVGINYGVTRHFGLGLDYIFTSYQNMKSTWPEFSILFTEKVKSHYIGLSGIYSF